MKEIIPLDENSISSIDESFDGTINTNGQTINGQNIGGINGKINGKLTCDGGKCFVKPKNKIIIDGITIDNFGSEIININHGDNSITFQEDRIVFDLFSDAKVDFKNPNPYLFLRGSFYFDIQNGVKMEIRNRINDLKIPELDLTLKSEKSKIKFVNGVDIFDISNGRIDLIINKDFYLVSDEETKLSPTTKMGAEFKNSKGESLIGSQNGVSVKLLFKSYGHTLYNGDPRNSFLEYLNSEGEIDFQRITDTLTVENIDPVIKERILKILKDAPQRGLEKIKKITFQITEFSHGYDDSLVMSDVLIKPDTEPEKLRYHVLHEIGHTATYDLPKTKLNKISELAKKLAKKDFDNGISENYAQKLLNGEDSESTFKNKQKLTTNTILKDNVNFPTAYSLKFAESFSKNGDTESLLEIIAEYSVLKESMGKDNAVKFLKGNSDRQNLYDTLVEEGIAPNLN